MTSRPLRPIPQSSGSRRPNTPPALLEDFEGWRKAPCPAQRGRRTGLTVRGTWDRADLDWRAHRHDRPDPVPRAAGVDIFGPQKPDISPARKRVADRVVGMIAEDLRGTHVTIRHAALLHLANDPSDYFTDRLRSVPRRMGWQVCRIGPLGEAARRSANAGAGLWEFGQGAEGGAAARRGLCHFWSYRHIRFVPGGRSHRCGGERRRTSRRGRWSLRIVITRSFPRDFSPV